MGDAGRRPRPRQWNYAIDPPHATAFDAMRCDGVWSVGCVVRVDGDEEAGGHLRVQLPADWAGGMEIRHHGEIPAEHSFDARRPEITADGINGHFWADADATMRFSINAGSPSREIDASGGDHSTVEVTIPSELEAVAALSTASPCRVSLDCADFDACSYGTKASNEISAVLNDAVDDSGSLITLSAGCDPSAGGLTVRLKSGD